jgi:PKD repeat protein
MEPLPSLGETGKLHSFDAAGTYQYASVTKRSYVDDAKLQYKWNFGDGSPAAYGKAVKHAFRSAATFFVELKVTNRETGQSDTTTRRVTIAEGGGSDVDPAAQASDAGGAVVACQSSSAFTSLSVKPSGAGLAFSGSTRDSAPFTATIYQAAKGKKATKLTKVTAFGVNGSYQWNPQGLARGTYIAQVSARGQGTRQDRRGFAFRYSGSRFGALKPFQRKDSCGLLSYLRLSSPVFGGRYALALGVATTRGARVTVTLTRKGKKRARKTVKTSANRISKVLFAPKKLPRGKYTVKVKAKAGKRKASGKLFAAKL